MFFIDRVDLDFDQNKMSRKKQVLDFFPEEDYFLIGIHCQWEAYRVAFLLNRGLKLKLKRERTDVDFQYKELSASYPLFRYGDEQNFRDYYLVANKFRGEIEGSQTQNSLFSTESLLTKNLVPEHKNVDFLLKVEGESQVAESKNLVSAVNAIPQIRIAYEINIDTLKSKENLIFN